jgi:hypothetical protein
MNSGPGYVHFSESNWNFWIVEAFNSGSGDLFLRLAEQPSWSSIIMVKLALRALGARHLQRFSEKAIHHPTGLRPRVFMPWPLLVSSDSRGKKFQVIEGRKRKGDKEN